MKEEIPITAPPPGDILTGQAAMMSDYRYQIYFDLETGNYVAQNLKSDWDLGFECTAEGWRVILNTSKLMYAANSGETDFSLVKDTSKSYEWKIDGITGDLDSTAIGDWTIAKNIYIIDRGLGEDKKHRGFSKIQIESYDEKTFTIKYADLENDVTQNYVITKNPDLNFVAFSFDGSGDIVDIEPNRKDWDLLFTHYSEQLYDGVKFIPYLVVGAQINRFNTFACQDTLRSFDEIVLDDVAGYEFLPKIDQPGYKWKSYSLSDGSYVVDSKQIYIIKNRSGFFYKLRFVDFYDDNGDVGFPKFEYQRL